MIRLFLIEWIKLRKYRAFQTLMALYLFILTLICSSGMLFLATLDEEAANNYRPNISHFYSFPSVWQNLAYIASKLKIILALIAVLTITNEISYKTLRQNIIDGLTRIEFILSKLSMFFALSLVNTLLVFTIGILGGLLYSDDTSLASIVNKSEFLGGLFLNVFAFLVFALVLALLIRRTGIVIIFISVYTVVIEPIIALIFSIDQMPPIYGKVLPFFPQEAINNLTPRPFPLSDGEIVQDYISLSNWSIAGAEMLLFLGLILLLLNRKDKNY